MPEFFTSTRFTTKTWRPRWRNQPSYILFALGGFSPELQQLAANPAEQLFLVTNKDMLNPNR
jgi:hypothetical protein